MSRTSDFVNELPLIAAAGEAAIITGNTSEVLIAPGLPGGMRMPQAIAYAHAQAGRTTILYSVGQGARLLAVPGHQRSSISLPSAQTSPGVAIPEILRAIRNASERFVVVILAAESIVPMAPPSVTPSIEQAIVIEALQDTILDPTFEARGNALVLIASGELNRSLVTAAGFRRVRAPLPDAEDLEVGFQRLQQRAQQEPERFAPLADGLSRERAILASRGLRMDDAIRASRQAAATSCQVGIADLAARKAASIERHVGDALRLLAPGPRIDDVAELEHIKQYVHERRRSNAWPLVIGLVGPPGNGKTYVTRAFARERECHAVALHLVRSPYVGESEQRMAGVLEAIEEYAPVVVQVDEADQAMGQRSTNGSVDGGTSERLSAAVWEFTGEGAAHPNVLFILTSNRVDLLDPALRNRAEIIPILHPTHTQVAALLPVLAAQINRTLAEDADPASLAEHPKLALTSARHLLRIIARAATITDLETDVRNAPIPQRSLRAAIADYRPNTNAEDEELMALQALAHTSFNSLLPWSASPPETRDVPSYVAPLLDEHGDLDHERLLARISELSERLAATRARKQW